MSFNHYYQSELTALRQLGRQFAERSPALAPFLGQAGRDPDVERLLEGFAFLTGRLRQKLDDELPELTHSLMQLLWPNYMRPLPAFSILQFDPSTLAGPALKVHRDTPVDSVAIDGVPCRFRTCYTTDVQALDLASLTYSAKGERSLLCLRLEMTADGHVGELALTRLRLHLAGERYISQMLYLSLLHDLEGIELVPLDAAGKPLNAVDGMPIAFRLPSTGAQPVGFAEEEAMIPYPLNTFRGYRYLQEYFAFQDKFLFVDIDGLNCLATLPPDVIKQVRGFELRFDIRKSPVQRVRPTLDNVRLHCTPIVNLFKHDASPIRLDGKQDEYLLLPAVYAPEHCGVFSIDSVIGWKPGGFPGNVRELKGLVERAVLLCEGGELLAEHFGLTRAPVADDTHLNLRERLEHIERGLLLDCLRKNRGNQSLSARKLGLPRRTLLYRLARLNINPGDVNA